LQVGWPFRADEISASRRFAGALRPVRKANPGERANALS
jgi:hypothetical protein